MKDFIVYEHISGLPEWADEKQEEIMECIMEDCSTEKEAEKYVEYINKIQPTDKYDRRRNLYIYWIN